MTLQHLLDIDRQLTLALNGSDSIFWDNLAYVATNGYMWSAVVLTLLYVILKNNKLKEAMLVIGCLAAMMVVSNVLCSLVIKPYFMRLRPCQNPDLIDVVRTVRGYCESSYSFYSSHACNTFSLALFLSCLFRSTRLALAMFVWSLAMCVTRVYLGQHYLGDIVVGCLVGLVLGFLTYLLYDRLAARLGGSRLISEQFTSSGYLVTDIDVLLIVIVLNCMGVVLFSLTYGI